MRLYHEQAVGFAPIGGDLGEKFVRRYASGGRQARFFLDLRSNVPGDFGRARERALIASDVEVGLVERQRLDQVGVAFEDLTNAQGYRAVAREIGCHEHRLRAQAPGAGGGHGGLNTEGTRFIRRGAHDRAGSFPRHHHRFALELGIIALLDRGVERIHIDMDNLAWLGGRVHNGA